MMPATLSIITNTFPPEERGKALGTWAGVSALALAIGPVVGGYLVEYVSWQSIFYLNVPVAAGALAITLFSTQSRATRPSCRRLDLAGIAAISVGLGALTLALLEAPAWGWGSPRNVGLFAVAAAGLATFAAVERRVRVPMVDFSFFALEDVPRREPRRLHRVVRDARDVLLHRDLHADDRGLHAARGRHPLPADDALHHRHLAVSGRLSDRIGPRPLMTAGLLLVAVSLFWQSHLTVGSGFAFLAPGFVLMGVGMASSCRR